MAVTKLNTIILNIIINADECEPLNTFRGSCQLVIVLAVTIYNLTIYGMFCRIIIASSIQRFILARWDDD